VGRHDTRHGERASRHRSQFVLAVSFSSPLISMISMRHTWLRDRLLLMVYYTKDMHHHL
jgi:hypothetical protein